MFYLSCNTRNIVRLLLVYGILYFNCFHVTQNSFHLEEVLVYSVSHFYTDVSFVPSKQKFISHNTFY